MPRLMIVIPCYNEEEVLPLTFPAISEVLKELIDEGKITSDSGALFVNDGSRDRTWELIEEEFEQNDLVYGLNLAGNVGHQNALLAGLEAALEICDIAISIDADLQDDVSAIKEMVEKYENGADIVYGVRSDRKTDSFFKRTTAQGFYKVMNALGVKSVYNHADYRLMSSRAIRHLLRFDERNMFLRGIVPMIGYKTDCVYYSRKERAAGESKYPLKKMLSFAWDGITSFSIKPIRLITALGFIIILCSLIAFAYILISYFCGTATAGWSSLMVSIWFLGGVQLFSIGMVGEYIGKTYIESKHRPRYNIETFLTHDDFE